jgi:hypothetical protein
LREVQISLFSDQRTGYHGNGLQVGAWAGLEVDGDWARGARPLDGEGLAGYDIEVAVGEQDSLGDAGKGSGNKSELHFGGWGWRRKKIR